MSAGASDQNGGVPTYRDQAVVLRTHNLGEADRIITLLCREHGKVRAVAKGVRRTSSKFGGRLEPFSHVDIQFATGHSLDVVTQVESLAAYGGALATDYQRFTAGEVMIETADRLVAVEDEPARQQYWLLVGGLRTLAQGTVDGPRPATMVLDSYLLRSLALAGYAPILTECVRCGRKGPHEWFAPSLGGMVCAECRPPGATKPDPQAWTLLGALLAGDWPTTRDMPARVQRQTSGLVAAFVSWHLDHALRSLPLLERADDAG